jgi:hypothetical protein
MDKFNIQPPLATRPIGKKPFAVTREDNWQINSTFTLV